MSSLSGSPSLSLCRTLPSTNLLQSIEQLLLDGIIELCGSEGLLLASGLTLLDLLVDRDDLGSVNERQSSSQSVHLIVIVAAVREETLS